MAFKGDEFDSSDSEDDMASLEDVIKELSITKKLPKNKESADLLSDDFYKKMFLSSTRVKDGVRYYSKQKSKIFSVPYHTRQDNSQRSYDLKRKQKEENELNRNSRRINKAKRKANSDDLSHMLSNLSVNKKYY